MVVVDTRHHMLRRLASIITKELLNGQKVVMRTIRGMIPHKTKREATALARFKAYVGVPPPYDKMKMMGLKASEGSQVAFIDTLCSGIFICKEMVVF
ncbi:hypothetical protein Q3G72_018181 [Acer saccharum]|nr:hypothetical protein Q3G72_018181 [Acer saccharum]